MNFAFFWVGEDISIPRFLVQSIRSIYGEDATIFQLSDSTTPPISGVTEVLRKNLSKYLMLARLEAYALVETNNPTCFLDADSLLINKIELPPFANHEAMLVEREDKTNFINFNYPFFFS